jgi:hypothetical protein
MYGKNTNPTISQNSTHENSNFSTEFAFGRAIRELKISQRPFIAKIREFNLDTFGMLKDSRQEYWYNGKRCKPRRIYCLPVMRFTLRNGCR